MSLCTRSGYCSTMSIATHPAFVIFHYVINGTAAPCPSPRTLLMFICHYRILCHMPLSYRMSYAIIVSYVICHMPLSYLMSHAIILSYVTCHYLINGTAAPCRSPCIPFSVFEFEYRKMLGTADYYYTEYDSKNDSPNRISRWRGFCACVGFRLGLG